MFLNTKTKKDCCGCSACSNICSVSAITMKEDRCGFFYPHINNDLCVHCDRCRKVCPMNIDLTNQTADPEIYALRNQNSADVKQSSSGGMFSLLAQWTLSQGGVIYGVAFDDAFRVKHLRGKTVSEVLKFRTSKYVESDISEVYLHIKDDLDNGLVVLLTGTPCQISGISRYLKFRHVCTDKLYTCDNICHGVPSHKVWEDYLNILKTKYIAPDDEITSVNMRSKKVSWKEKQLDISLKNGNIDSIIKDFSFNRIFASLYTARPSCFHCHYTSYRRPSDITLGDFWTGETAGLPFDTEQGVSEVLINTTKGQELFNQLKDRADICPLSKKQGWQPHLEYSSRQPKKYQAFWSDYTESSDKEAVLRKYMKGSPMTRVIRLLSPVLRKTGLYNLAGKLYNVLPGKKG